MGQRANNTFNRTCRLTQALALMVWIVATLDAALAVVPEPRGQAMMFPDVLSACGCLARR